MRHTLLKSSQKIDMVHVPFQGATGALQKVGFTPVGGSSEQFRQLVIGTIDKWGKVVREAKLKVE